MNESIFRKKSLDRISSPEQLTDYIRVSSPSVWIVLAAVVVLLISVLIWSVFGTLPTTLKVSTYIKGGTAICYVDSSSVATIKKGMTVQIGKVSGTVAAISALPVSTAQLSKKYDDYIVKSLASGQWNYAVKVNISGVPDGLYEMVITISSVKPISFVLN